MGLRFIRGVYTIEWFVHINIFVFRWMCFSADCFRLIDTLHERQQGLNWTEMHFALNYHSIWIGWNEWMDRWINERMKVCVVCWRRCELDEWPLHSSKKTKSSGFFFFLLFSNLTCFAWFSMFFQFFCLSGDCFIIHIQCLIEQISRSDVKLYFSLMLKMPLRIPLLLWAAGGSTFLVICVS